MREKKENYFKNKFKDQFKGRSDQVQERMEVTDRDIGTLRWVAQWWGVTVAQVDRWWRLPAQVGLHGPDGPPRTEVARRRLAAMESAGLLTAHRMPTSPAHIYAVTRAGLHVAGLAAWTAPRWRWSQFRHEHATTSVALDLLDAGWEVVPERRMRQEDTLGIASWSLALATERGALSHYPDLWVRPTEDTPWRAVEIELARKSLSRLTGILAAYRDRRSGVTYYTAEAPVAQAVRRAATRVRLEDLDVRRLPSAGARQVAPATAGVGGD